MGTSDLRFDEAINPYGCSPRVVEAMTAFAQSRGFRFYGDEADAESLRADLAAHFRLSPENFLVYNGAGEAVAWLYIVHLILGRGSLIVPYPSYERFVEGAKLCTDKVVEVPLEGEAWALPVDRIVDEGRRQRVSVGLISNPNNPTGNVLADERAMRTLLEQMPETLWIVDEAFADYTGVTFVPWVSDYQNLVVLRTFSKAYGLAGLRVGYLAAHPAVVRPLAPFRIPWGVDSMALVAAQAALADQAYLREIVARILRDCEAFRSALGAFPYLEPRAGRANFFLVRMRGADPERIRAHLAEHHIRVRRRPDLPDHIRITSLTDQENRRFVEAMRALEVPV